MNPPRLLVIDDDESIRSMYLRKFTHEQFDVVTAVNGVEGLAKIKEQRPDMILLDVMMPGGMNGFDVLETLKRSEEWKTIPVIMLTNLSSEEGTAKDIGAVEYVVKANIDLDDLVKKIRGYLSPPSADTH